MEIQAILAAAAIHCRDPRNDCRLSDIRDDLIRTLVAAGSNTNVIPRIDRLRVGYYGSRHKDWEKTLSRLDATRENRPERRGQVTAKQRTLRFLLVCSGNFLFLSSPHAQVIHAPAKDTPRSGLIHPHAIAIHPRTHRLYAIDQPGNRVLAREPDGTTSSIAVGSAPVALAIDASANRIYVVNSGSGTVSVIDGTDAHVIATIKTEAHPYAIAVDSTLHRAYVTNTYSDKVTVIDGATNTAAQLALGSQDFVAVDEHQHQAFFISYENPALTVMDAGNRTHGETMGLSHPWGLAVDAERGVIYITEIGADTLLAIREDGGKTVRLQTGSMPDAVAVDTAAKKIYVANYAGNTVTIIDGETMQVVATLPVGKCPQAVAVDEKRHHVYVANSHSDTVTVIGSDTNTVLATVPAGRSPYAIAVDTNDGDVFTANDGPHPFTRLNLSQLVR